MTVNFGCQVLKGMEDLKPEPHQRWFRDVYIQKNPDLLPENYDLPALQESVRCDNRKFDNDFWFLVEEALRARQTYWTKYLGF